MKELSANKKFQYILTGFILFFVIFSIIYIIFNPAQSSNNPGGTGGDFTPPNTVTITNEGVLYDSLGSANTDIAEDIIEIVVLYNTSVSNDPDAASIYTKFDSFDPKGVGYYRPDKSYTVTMDNKKAISINQQPWNYRFNLTVDDGRHIQLDTNINPEDPDPIMTATLQ